MWKKGTEGCDAAAFASCVIEKWRDRRFFFPGREQEREEGLPRSSKRLLYSLIPSLVAFKKAQRKGEEC